MKISESICHEVVKSVTLRIRGCSYAHRLGLHRIVRTGVFLAEAVRVRNKAIGTEEGESYRAWVTEAPEKSVGPAHSLTRQTEKAPPLTRVYPGGCDNLEPSHREG